MEIKKGKTSHQGNLFEYTQKEYDLFKTLGFSDLFFVIECTPTLYKIAAMDAFVNNKSGPAIDSLRRCCLALDSCHPYRCTEEFDELIQLY